MRYLRFQRRDTPTLFIGAIAGVAMILSVAAAGGADTPAKPAKAPSVKQSAISKKVDAAVKKGPAVVVGYLPSGVVDKVGLVEARAAANTTGAEFVALDVSKKPHAQELLSRFSVTTTPTVMIVSQQGKVMTQLSGYADRQTVRQAVRNAEQ